MLHADDNRRAPSANSCHAANRLSMSVGHVGCFRRGEKPLLPGTVQPATCSRVGLKVAPLTGCDVEFQRQRVHRLHLLVGRPGDTLRGHPAMVWATRDMDGGAVPLRSINQGKVDQSKDVQSDCHPHDWGLPRRRSAAAKVFSSRHATVIGPTPPGTGVMVPATAAAVWKATSPTRRPSNNRLIPTSMTVAPGFIQ